MRLLRSGRRNGSTDTAAVNVRDETPVIEACAGVDESAQQDRLPESRRRPLPAYVLTYGVLPALLLLLAAAGLLKWQDGSVRNAQAPATESVRAATDGTIALLSYKPDTVETDLAAARGRLTGPFLDAYTLLTHDVVIPGAKQKKISAVATVPAAASVSSTDRHAVALLFVNQLVTIGQDAPTNTASSVRVTLDKVDGRWLISQFDPV